MDKKLSDLLLKKSKAGKLAEINWDERRDKYLDAVRELYDQIETILAEPITQKTVMVHRRPKELTESYIGSYSAEDLILIVGDEQVRFSPRGRNIAGATGRVDVLGERNEAILMLTRDSNWEFVQTRQPSLRTLPFDESTFGEVLQLVMRS